MKISRRQHITLFIAFIMIVTYSLAIVHVPTTKSLETPFWWYGFVDYYDNSNVSTTIVTLTDVDQGGNSMTTTTDNYGFYAADLSEITDSADGDYIVVNCSNSSQVGENASTIDIIGYDYQYCNLSGGTRLEPENLSISVNDSSWNPGDLSIGANSYNATSDTCFNLTNEGNVKINVAISGENITFNGGSYTWYINDTPSLNNYTLQFKKSGEGSWTPINYSNLSFVTDLQYNSDYFTYTYWQQFGLNITMPTSSTKSDTGQLSTNITFWSIKA